MTSLTTSKRTVMLIMMILQGNIVQRLGFAFVPETRFQRPSSFSARPSANRNFFSRRPDARQSRPITTSTVISATASGGHEENDGIHVRKRDVFASFLHNNKDRNNIYKQKIRERLKAKRPDIESGRRYRSKDWLINILSLPNSFVLRRIKFHLITNTLLSVLFVLVNRFWFPLSIPTMAHTMLGG